MRAFKKDLRLLECGFSKQPQLRSLTGRSMQLLLSIPKKVVIEIKQKESWGVRWVEILHPCVSEATNN